MRSRGLEGLSSGFEVTASMKVVLRVDTRDHGLQALAVVETGGGPFSSDRMCVLEPGSCCGPAASVLLSGAVLRPVKRNIDG